MKFARKFGASEAELLAVVTLAPDADLGGHVYKYRLARMGAGKSGGARMIVAMQVEQRLVILYGFAKKDMASITSANLVDFREVAEIFLNFTDKQLDEAIAKRQLKELGITAKKTTK